MQLLFGRYHGEDEDVLLWLPIGKIVAQDENTLMFSELNEEGDYEEAEEVPSKEVHVLTEEVLSSTISNIHENFEVAVEEERLLSLIDQLRMFGAAISFLKWPSSADLLQSLHLALNAVQRYVGHQEDDDLLDRITKRTVETWLGLATGFKRVISATQANVANERLRKLNEYYPSEFQRAPRPFSVLAFWRAHEFRQFLLYNVYAVMHDILSMEHLEHILTLQMFCRLLLLNVENERSTIDYCMKLAKILVTKSCELFGQHWATYNTHGITHVAEDVFRHGGMEEISCFKFESFLFFVKRLVRSGRLPLKQAINRYMEWLSACERLAALRVEDDERVARPTFVTSHPCTFTEAPPQYVTYRRLTTGNSVLRSDRVGDKCCLVVMGRRSYFIEVSYFARAKENSRLYVAGKRYKSASSLYDFGFGGSSSACVYRCGKLSTTEEMFSMDEGSATSKDQVQKLYRVPLFGTDDFVCSTLAHD